MYEVIVDRFESLDPSEYNAGASFYFVDEELTELIHFIELCFQTNTNRDSILIKRADK